MKLPRIGMAFSLKTKTRLIFGFLLLCFITQGTLAYRSLSVIIEQSKAVSQIWIPRTAVVEDLQTAAHEYRISEALRILSVTPEMAEQADADLQAYAEQFQSKLVAYRKLLPPGESSKQLNTAAELWATYQLGNEQMLAYSRENRTDEAANRFRNSASKFYLLTNALDELSDYNAKQSAAAIAEATALSEEGHRLVAVNFTLMGVIVIFAAVFLELTVWRALVRLAGVMKRLARSDFEVEISGVGRRDEVGDMARAVQVFKDNGLEVRRLEAAAELNRRQTEEERRANEEMRTAAEEQRAFVVASIATGLAELSSGDLTYRLTDDFAPEFRKLQDDFNIAMDNLQQTMRVITLAAGGIHAGTEEISLASDKLARRTEKQAANLEEAAAALEHITQTVRTSAESAKQAKKAVASAKANAEQSGQVVGNTVSAMSEIERSARQISEIIGVMDEIAFQTNLLALNAGIEAARAGEAGRGFAVVASEVRALAQRSTVAAKEIKLLISSSSQHVGSGVSLVAETGKALEQISVQVAEINASIGEIAAVAEEQAAGLLQINSTVSAMDKGTQQNAAMSQEATAASHVLAQEANELARLIGKFQIGETEAVKTVRQVPASVAPRPGPQGHAILRGMSGGAAAVAARLESAISEDGWEEF